MGVPFVAGQRLTAADLNTATQQSAWITSFTPSWTQTGQTPSFGNATIATGYGKVGRIVNVRYQFIFGNTTNFGSGNNAWNFTLPVAANLPASQFWNIGSWSALVASTFWTGAVRLESTGVIGLFVSNSTFSVHTTNPGTWASGNYLQMSMTYESTS